MKRLVYIICILALVSCEKELTEEPKSVAAEVFYNSAAEADAAVAGIFVPLRDPNCMSGLYPAQLESYSDYGYGRGSYGPLNEYNGLDNTNATRAGQMWDLFYRAIRNANIVIRNVPNGTNISEADITKYVAEARFMRGLIYLQMVRNWGGLPIRTEENMELPDVGRSSEAEVYDLILSDLQYAETNLPDVGRPAGKPSRWSAKAVLTEVFLIQQQWAQARDKALEIIQSNKFSLVPVSVADDFDKIFGPDVNNTSEEIFYLKFSRTGTNQGWFYVMFEHHPGARLHGAGGYFAHYTDAVSNPFTASWDNNDLRKKAWLYPFNIGLGANSLLFKKFKDPVATGIYNAGNDYPLYRYADVLLFYAEAEARAGGPSADAMEKLNMVHRRAYGLPSTTPSAVDFDLADYTQATFLDLVIRERGYETLNEAKRWLDLKRMGIVRQVVQTVKGKTVADKHLLWPIPNSELNYNKALDATRDQNPGY